MMSPIDRIIDANANRAAEALRLAEDAARLALNDAALCSELKAIRHQLNEAIRTLFPCELTRLASRDTPGDVGTAISTPTESARAPGLRDITGAAFSRLSQSLRAIEECAKALGHPDVASSIETARYRCYTLHQAIITRLPSPTPPQWRVCVLITESLCTHHSWQKVCELAVTGGADALQLREKYLPDAELLRRARTLVDICRGAAAAIINDRPDIAFLAGAQAVHLGWDDTPPDLARTLTRGSLLIGLSTHSLDEASAAIAAGADYCGVGPMFHTTTKDLGRPAGIEYLREYLAIESAPPHLAIGGISPQNISSLAAAGCRGVAVSSCVCASPAPSEVCAALCSALCSALPPSAARG